MQVKRDEVGTDAASPVLVGSRPPVSGSLSHRAGGGHTVCPEHRSAAAQTGLLIVPRARAAWSSPFLAGLFLANSRLRVTGLPTPNLPQRGPGSSAVVGLLSAMARSPGRRSLPRLQWPAPAVGPPCWERGAQARGTIRRPCRWGHPCLVAPSQV